MYISIKYKYVIIYSILTLLPVVMFHIWIYQIWSEKLYRTIADTDSKLVAQLSGSMALTGADRNGELLRRLVANSGLDSQSDLVVLSRSGELLYSSNNLLAAGEVLGALASREKSGGDFVTGDFLNEDMLVTYREAPGSQERIAVFTPTRVIDDQLSSMKWLMIVLIALSVLLSVVSVILISFHLTSPIRTLRKKLEELEHGRMDALEEQDTVLKDEIWRIGISFNGIVSRLREQVKLHYQLQMKSDEARWLALQSQINPHFLHNTLETINAIALIEQVPVITQLSRSLSKMFRYNTIQSSRFVTLKEELEHVENYLNVQLIRFDGVISSRIEVDPGLLEKRTIKFILQPIIENCFVHGFKDLDDQGHIGIRGYSENEHIVICIEDNGEGIDGEQLARINEQLRYPVVGKEEDSVSSPQGVGLSNVNTRLKIAFGPAFGLSCLALSPRGLSVQITLPFVQREDGDVSIIGR